MRERTHHSRNVLDLPWVASSVRHLECEDAYMGGVDLWLLASWDGSTGCPSALLASSSSLTLLFCLDDSDERGYVVERIDALMAQTVDVGVALPGPLTQRVDCKLVQP